MPPRNGLRGFDLAQPYAASRAHAEGSGFNASIIAYRACERSEAICLGKKLISTAKVFHAFLGFRPDRRVFSSIREVHE